MFETGKIARYKKDNNRHLESGRAIAYLILGSNLG
jgi:hypothetical protein